MTISLLLASFLSLAFAEGEEPIVTAASGAAAEEAIQEKDPVKAAVEMQPRPKDGKFKSWFPVAGYNPTYGVFLGGGYFRKLVEGGEPASEWSVTGIISQKKAVKLEWRVNKKIGKNWGFVMRHEWGNGFESNYGLGNETKTADRVDVDLWKNEIDLFFPYQLLPRLRIGPYIESRIRRNHGMDPAEVARQKDPLPDREFSLAAGFQQVLDYRNIPNNPSLGWHQALRVFRGFPYVGPKRRPFTVIDSEIQMFQYLIEKDLVLATGLAGGVIFGEAPYLSQFRLGGTDRLRGFFYGRFRGSKYYVQQNELRFPIMGWFSGASFLEFGEVTEKHFSRAHVAYGIGLRIGLPPDKVSKMRIDYAMSRDQKGIFVDFGHAF